MSHRLMILLALAALPSFAALPARAATPAEEARIELTTYATLYGAGLGLWTAVELDLNPRPAAWLSAGLAGGALWGTWEAAKAADLQPNRAALISSAAAWAMVDTLLIAAALDVWEDEAVWLTFGTGAAAAGVAFAASSGLSAGVGDLSLINSGGLWMPLAATLLAAPVIDDIVNMPFVWILGTSTLGLLGGVALSTQLEPTRQQALYLDAGLAVGAVGGGLLGVMGAVLTDSLEVGAWIALAGMVTGGLVAVDLAGLDGAAVRVQPATEALRGARRPAPARSEPLPMPLWVGTW